MKSPIKICIISLDSYPLFNPNVPQTFGGAEVQFFLLSQSLVKDQNFEISFIVGDYEQKENIEERTGILLYKRLNSFGLPFLRLMKKVGADIYISSGSGRTVGKWAFFAWLLGKKFIYMVASDIDCNGDFERQSSFFGALWYRLGLRFANMIVAQNNYQKDLLNKRGYNNILIMKKILEDLSENFLEKQNSYILWVGRCEEWKRPEIFIELAQKFIREKFKMICSPVKDNPSFFNKIHSLADNVSNLSFSSREKYDKMDNIYKKAKIIVTTSDFEGDLPIVILESLKYGTPVLSLNVNPDNCFDKYKFGFFARGDIKTLEKNLELLLGDKILYNKCQIEGQKYYKLTNDKESIVKKYTELFNKIMKR